MHLVESPYLPVRYTSGGVDVLLEDRPQSRASTVQQHPLVLLAEAEQLADLLGRVTLDVAQPDDQALTIGKLRQRGLQVVAGLEREQRVAPVSATDAAVSPSVPAMPRRPSGSGPDPPPAPRRRRGRPRRTAAPASRGRCASWPGWSGSRRSRCRAPSALRSGRSRSRSPSTSPARSPRPRRRRRHSAGDPPHHRVAAREEVAKGALVARREAPSGSARLRPPSSPERPAGSGPTSSRLPSGVDAHQLDPAGPAAD